MSEDYVLAVDISHHQGDDIDFKMMKSRGVKVVFMKRSEGNYFTDFRFDKNWKGTQDADMIPSPYHFVSPWNDTLRKPVSGQENAEYFLKLLEGYEPTLPLCGDCEKGMSNTPELVTTTIQKFFQTIGYPNINYTADWFWNAKVKPWSGWKNSLLWVMSIPYYNSGDRSHYPNHELFLEYLSKGSRFPVLPRALDGKPSWDTWAIWQFSHQGDGRYYGLKRGKIDLDLVKPELLTGIPVPPPIPDPQPERVIGSMSVQVNDKIYSGTTELLEQAVN